jgi:hypothetical protein
VCSSDLVSLAGIVALVEMGYGLLEQEGTGEHAVHLVGLSIDAASGAAWAGAASLLAAGLLLVRWTWGRLEVKWNAALSALQNPGGAA